jgi:hypothetical protein
MHQAHLCTWIIYVCRRKELKLKLIIGTKKKNIYYIIVFNEQKEQIYRVSIVNNSKCRGKKFVGPKEIVHD